MGRRRLARLVGLSCRVAIGVLRGLADRRDRARQILLDVGASLGRVLRQRAALGLNGSHQFARLFPGRRDQGPEGFGAAVGGVDEFGRAHPGLDDRIHKLGAPALQPGGDVVLVEIDTLHHVGQSRPLLGIDANARSRARDWTKSSRP